MSRVVSEIILHRSTLEKLLSKDDNLEDEERMKDVLNALLELQMTVEILKETNIGQILQDIKNKFPEAPVGLLAKKVIAKYRKDCKGPEEPKKVTIAEAEGVSEEKKPRPSVQLVNSKKEKIDASEVKQEKSQIKLTKSKSFDEDEWNEDHYDKLSDMRRKIMQLLTESLKVSCAESIARFTAFKIEDSINQLHPQDRDPKSYSNKAKSLTFSIKTNEELRNRLIDGTLSSETLVTMAPKDMAPQALQAAREEMSNMNTKSRRSDLYQLAAAEIQAAHGIDPNKGEFQCKRCKGTKTSHYSMQTRSSDEPMTVFVCCLTCGNRWRC